MDLHLLTPGEPLSSAARLVAGALIAGLWQGTLLCAATGLLLRAIPRSTAKLRFVVWSAVFCVSAAIPFVNLATALLAAPEGVAAGPRWVFDVHWSYVLAAVWVLAAACQAGRLLLQALGLRALWKSAVPVLAESLAGSDLPPAVAKRKVEICTSSDVDRPSVIGFSSPRILIPEWLFGQLSATELNHIVLHEMEHLRRRDDWMNLLQKIGLVLLPLNPALFWIDRRLSTERELACDDGVLERTKAPRAYAASLTSVAERRIEARRSSRMAALALAATGLLRRRSELGERIERILGRRSPVNPVFAGAAAALLVAGIVGAAAGLARAPQLVSFGGGESARQASVLAAATATPPPGAGALPAVTRGQLLPAAGFQNVSFHQLVKTANLRRKPAIRRRAGLAAASQISAKMAVPPPQPRFVVLTSWEDSPVSRVVIETPDGKFFAAPYAALPTQAGWLIVQL